MRWSKEILLPPNEINHTVVNNLIPFSGCRKVHWPDWIVSLSFNSNFTGVLRIKMLRYCFGLFSVRKLPEHCGISSLNRVSACSCDQRTWSGCAPFNEAKQNCQLCD